MQQVNVPNLTLNNIEFLCLKMAANPGQTGRWYLRELHRYRFGTLGEGSWNAIYMSPSGRYRGRLFIDESPKVRVARGWKHRNCSAVGRFELLPVGRKVAERAAAKIGISL